MVGTDPLEVDQLLTDGELRCPGCAGALRPWGHARERGVRDETAVVMVRPRRSWCSRCRCTHVLLPVSTLVRRADTVVVIGRALLAKAAGAGHRSVAALLDRPVSTVRGWLRRFGVRAEGLRVLTPHVPDVAARGGTSLRDLVEGRRPGASHRRQRDKTYRPWQLGAALERPERALQGGRYGHPRCQPETLPLLCGAYAFGAYNWPATGSTLARLSFPLSPADAPLPGRLLLRIHDPAEAAAQVRNLTEALATPKVKRGRRTFA